MTQEELLDLLRRAAGGDKAAEEELVRQNAGLIWSVARRFFGRGVDPDDLYQLGSLGLVKAIRGFDPAFGTRFSTYAVPKIAGEIRRFLRDDGQIKLSRSVKETAAVLRLASERLRHRLGREPALTELSRETGIPPEEIAACETATQEVASLQQEAGEDGFSLEEMLSESAGEEALAEGVDLRAAIAGLPEQERAVIALRYYRGLTQQNAAALLKVSQVQVSRLERRAVERLRERLQ